MSCENCENLGRNKGIYAEVFEQIAADESREVGIAVNFCPTCSEPLTASKPLTLEELKERDGKPVYYVGISNKRRKWIIVEKILLDRAGSDNYGITWLAYDREPKEDV